MVLEGYFDKACKALFSEKQNIKICLWGLSNIVLEEAFADHFFSQEQVFSRTMQLMQSKNQELRSEAAFVMTNAITSCGYPTLEGVYQQEGQDLISTIINCLQMTVKTNFRLLMCLLESISRLLLLDLNQMGLENCVNNVAKIFESCNCIEVIE
jgi:hypothetical protein